MSRRCRSCGGVYAPVLADGFRYFHVCPDVSGVVVTRAGRTAPVPLAELLPTDLVSVARGGASLDIPAAQREPGDVLLGAVALPRADLRDENIDRERARRALEESGARRAGVTDEELMKAAGAGVDELDPPAPRGAQR